MKILLAQYSHESNTFTPLTTKLSDYVVKEGEDLLKLVYKATKVFQDAGCELVPVVYCTASPSGTNEREVYDFVEKKISDALDANPDLDGIWVHLHGANYVKEIGHAELALLKMIRAKVGPDIPIAWAMDPHGNVGPEHIKYADILRAYRTVPHVDVQETDEAAAKALLERIRLGNKVEPVYVRVPVLVGGEQSVGTEEPMKSVFQRLWELDQMDGILMASYTVGFVWGDTPCSTAAVAITPRTEADRELCIREAEKLRDLVVENREKFQFAVLALSPDDAVQRSIEEEEGPVYVSDSGDNPQAGATGCNTVMLEKYLKADLKGKKVLLASIFDIESTHKALEYNVGDDIEIDIGACLDEYSQKVRVCGKVKAKGDLIFRTGEKFGDVVTISCGDVDVVLEDRAESFTEMEYFKRAGLDVNDYDVIVVKLGYLFPELDEHAKLPIMCLTPGASYQIVAKLPFTKIPRPTYPMDEI